MKRFLTCLALVLASSVPAWAQLSDDSLAPTPVTDGLYTTDTTAATADGLNPGCGGGTDPIDLWAEYTNTSGSGGILTVSMCTGATAYDSRLAIWDTALTTALACNDDTCGLQSEVSFGVAPGDTILIQVGGFNAAIGTGEIDISFQPAASGGALVLNESGAFTPAPTAPFALDCLGVPYVEVTNQADALAQLTSGATFDILVLDISNFQIPVGGPFETELVNYVNGGGAVVMSYWDLDLNPALATAMGVDSTTFVNLGAPTDMVAGPYGADVVWTTPNALTIVDTAGGFTGFGSYGNELIADIGAGAEQVGEFAGSTNASIVRNGSGLTYCYGHVWPSHNAQGIRNSVANAIVDALDAAGAPVASPTACGPLNDICDNASPAAIGAPFAYTTAGAQDEGTGGCTNGDDVWYTAFGVIDGPIGLEVDAGDNTTVEIYTGGCPSGGGLSLTGCQAVLGGTPLSVDAATSGWNILTGEQIWIRVIADNPGASGSITVTYLAPDNDNCDGALPAFDGLNAFDSSGASDSSDPYNDAQCAGSFLGAMASDIWFEYVATSDGLATISFCTGLTTIDTDVVIYEGACPSLGGTQIGCNGDSCGLQSEAIFGVTTGTSYFIRIGSWGAGAAGGPGEFEITVQPFVNGGALVLDETTPLGGSSTASLALDCLSVPYVETNDQAAFLSQLTSGSTFDILVIDGSNFTIPAAGAMETAIIDFINAGGAVVLSYWNMDINPALAAAMGIDTASFLNIGTPTEIVAGPYAADAIWNTPNALLSSPAGGLAIFGSYGNEMLPDIGVAAEQVGEFATSTNASIIRHNAGATYAYGHLWASNDPQTIRNSVANSITAALTAIGVPPTSPSACGPLNDLCDNAAPVGLDAVVAFDTSGAQDEGNDPGCTPAGAEDAWWTLVVPCDGDLGVELNATTDAKISVWLGGCPGVGSPVALAGATCATVTGGTSLSIPPTLATLAGDIVYVQISGVGGVGATGDFQITSSGTPINNGCTNAIDLSTLPASDTWDTTCASQEAPFPCGAGGGPDVWYTITAPSDGILVIDTFGSAFDTVIEAFDSCGGTSLGCNDDAGGTLQSQLLVPVLSGDVILIHASGWAGATGAGGVINLDISVPPANDECDPGAVTAVIGINDFDSTLASTSGDVYDDLTCAGTFLGAMSSDVWFTYDATADEPLTLTLCGLTTLDTDVVIYEGGCPISGGVQIACNGDSCGLQSQVAFNTIAGNTYAIRIGVWGAGAAGGIGQFELIGPQDVTGKYIIRDGDLGGDIDDNQAITDALLNNGVAAGDILSLGDIAAAPLGGTPAAVFVLTGTFPADGELTPAEGTQIQTWAAAGVPVAHFGADTVGFHAPTDYFLVDGVDDVATADGGDTVVDLISVGAFAGVVADATYTQDQVGDDYTDELVVSTTDSLGADSTVAQTDGSGLINVGVYYNTNVDPGDVFHASTEFGGYGDAAGRDAYMAALLGLIGAGGGTTGPEFVRGDANGDGGNDISDAIFILSSLFVPGSPAASCADAADVNDDGGNDISDAIFTLSALFVPGSPSPPAPFPGCGEDPTDGDPLDCASFPPCP